MNRRHAKAATVPEFPDSRWTHPATNKSEAALDQSAIDVLRTEIGKDPDRGIDPYNHTGQHVLISLLGDSNDNS